MTNFTTYLYIEVTVSDARLFCKKNILLETCTKCSRFTEVHEHIVHRRSTVGQLPDERRWSLKWTASH